MAIYGLSFPHAASAIPPPKVSPASAPASAPAAAAAAAAPFALVPAATASAADAMLALPFPAFPTLSAPAPASASASASSGAAGDSDLELSTFELLRTTHGSQMVFLNVQVAPNETIRFSLKVNKHLVSRARMYSLSFSLWPVCSVVCCGLVAYYFSSCVVL
jgi:hypothetical protein